jgi:hypothetical protein
LNKNCCSSLLYLDLSITRVHKISKLLVINLKICNSDRCCQSFSAILQFSFFVYILKTHLQNSFFLIPLNGIRFSSSSLSICKYCWIIPWVNMFENLFTNIIEKKLVINRWMSHCIVGTVVTSMESKFFYFSILGITQSYLLALHLNNILRSFINLFIVKRTHSDCNFYAVCHKIIYFECLIKSRNFDIRYTFCDWIWNCVFLFFKLYFLDVYLQIVQKWKKRSWFEPLSYWIYLT